jgi:hypothetical protein
MTSRERSKALRPVRTAWEDGNEIEFNNKHDESGWLIYKGESPDWYNKAIEWRVKTAPMYRQWFANEVPLGAVLRNKKSGDYRALIVATWQDGQIIRVANNDGSNKPELLREDADTMLTYREWKWPHEDDNAWRPCGVEEET